MALELNIRNLTQNMHGIYFSYKVHHKRRLKKLEPYFSDIPMNYYAFLKITVINKN
jgi:hypothetical protein